MRRLRDSPVGPFDVIAIASLGVTQIVDVGMAWAPLPREVDWEAFVGLETRWPGLFGYLPVIQALTVIYGSWVVLARAGSPGYGSTQTGTDKRHAIGAISRRNRQNPPTRPGGRSHARKGLLRDGGETRLKLRRNIESTPHSLPNPRCS